MSSEYRKNKTQIPALYLSEEEATIVVAAIEKAAQKTGVTNNRKNRLALLEMARHYNETA
ncbi:hypothetical protein GTG28_20590 [Vibrio sp. OCN044]|uniref:Uncharacterized protein n=1 Tax=Vibrio tetraodonis subsp. pristinus TaxID=2695891 RepID=A0A6L8M687_9VIBR|nr:hypothetical protein [Vibrio tetraodonis]MYM61602.1 hypothetical protein [Vibrio tetraodonis subsp. pristinus]